MTIDHDNRLKIFWDFFIGILATIVAIEFPLRLVLGYDTWEFHTYMNAIVTASFGLDIYFHFNTTTQLKGKWVTDKTCTAMVNSTWEIFVLSGVMSPYPIVVKVVTHQYRLRI